MLMGGRGEIQSITVAPGALQIYNKLTEQIPSLNLNNLRMRLTHNDPLSNYS